MKIEKMFNIFLVLGISNLMRQNISIPVLCLYIVLYSECAFEFEQFEMYMPNGLYCNRQLVYLHIINILVSVYL